MPGERIGNSNQYLTISGVVSAPAYSWASDNNTGLYRIGADNIGIAANGTKVLDIATTAVTITPATTLSAALTYGGVTLSNAVTGTGNMVLSASPTLTGTTSFPGSTTIDSSGNLGIAKTTPANAVQLGNCSILGQDANSFYAGVNFSSAGNYINTNFACQTYWDQTNAATVWRTAPSGTAGNAITFTERMRLTQAGNLGIGMTPARTLDVTGTGGFSGNLNVGGTSNVATGTIGIGVANNAAVLVDGRLDANTNTYGYRSVNGSAGTAAATLAVLGNGTNALQFNMFGTAFTTSTINRQGGGLITCDGPGGLTLTTGAAQPIYFGINSTEVARILTTGTFLVAKTAQDTSTGGVSIFKSSTNNNGRIDFVKSTTGLADAIANYYSGGYVGGMTYSDTATALVTSSDERIKQNITDVSSQLLVLADIKVREFEFIADPDKRVKGFIAQELYKVAPEAVYVGTETKDGSIDRPWAVNPTALIPILVKAIQELTTRLAALEAK